MSNELKKQEEYDTLNGGDVMDQQRAEEKQNDAIEQTQHHYSREAVQAAVGKGPFWLMILALSLFCIGFHYVNASNTVLYPKYMSGNSGLVN